MADTTQYICWGINQRCRFRDFDDYRDPHKSFDKLRRWKSVLKLSREDIKYGDFYIASHLYSSICPVNEKGEQLLIPDSAVIVSAEEEARVDELQKVCRDCSVNPNINDIGGCLGHCELSPISFFEEFIQRAIVKYDIDVERYFTRTTPQWYGLWMRPLKGEAILQLIRIVREIVESPGVVDSDDLNSFIRALQKAYKSGTELDFYVAPPGHFDFGFLTTFEHCPQCKAVTAEDKVWRSYSYPENYRCRVCGHIYNPNLTGSEVECGLDGIFGVSIADHLGKKRYLEFIKEYFQDKIDADAMDRLIDALSGQYFGT